MARTELMTWNAKQKRWFKKYRKKQYVVSPKQLGKPSTKAESLTAANEWWEEKRAELDFEDPERGNYEYAIWMRKNMREIAIASSEHQLSSELWNEISRLQDRLDVGGRLPKLSDEEFDPLSRFPHEDMKFWEDALDDVYIRRSNNLRSPSKEDDNTTSVSIAGFLQHKQVQVENDELSPGRYESLRCCLEHFQKSVDATKLLTSIDSKMLLDYRSQLAAEMKNGMSPAYARDHISAVKQFVRYCWNVLEKIELPRLINTKQLNIKVPENKIKTFTEEELRRLLESSSETTRLYLLLMLNCGMQQQDITELGQDEVNWKRGRIVRKRSKTEHHENVPTVNYRLWRETFSLLQNHRSDDKERVLLNAKGKPLKTEVIVNGKVKKSDNIRSAYSRVVRKLKLEPKPLKLIRKTCATKLADHPEYANCRFMYLGHSDVTIADKHYVKPNQKLFDQAILWLGKQFGLK